MRRIARRPAPGPFFGWYVVGACFCMAIFGWGLGFYAPGFYLLELTDRHRWSAVQVSAATTFYFLCGACLIMAFPAALRRWGPRPTIVAGICAMAAGTAAMSSVIEIWQLYAVYLVLAAGWATMSSTAIATILAPWFSRRRGLALGLALNGASAGGIAVVPVLVQLAQRESFGFATRAAAGLMLIVLIPLAVAVLGRRAPRPPAPAPPAAPAAPTAPEDGGQAEHDAPRAPGIAGLLRQPEFWGIAAPFALALTAQVGFLNHQLSILAPSLGAGRAALAVSVTSAAAVVGRLGLGLAADRVNLRWAAAVTFTVQAAALLALALAGPGTGPLPAYLACAAFGLSVGNVITLPALLIHQEFPAAAFTRVVSCSTTVSQLTYAFGPALLAIISDATGGYRAALALCVAFEALGAVTVRGRRSHRESSRREISA
jgi:MFS family permease